MESKKSGWSFCRDIPQKGHNGFGRIVLTTGSIKDMRSEG